MAKSISDKVDYASIALDVTEDDLERIRPILSSIPVVPNDKMSVYKNRRGAYNRIFLWMYANKGTCRYETMFATDFNYHPIDLKETELIVKKDDTKEEEKEPVILDGGDDLEF